MIKQPVPPTATVATKTVVNTQDESETDQETVNNPATASTTTTNNNNAPQAVQATTGSVTPAKYWKHE